MKHALLLAPLTLAACVGLPHRDAVAPAPAFDAFAFFDGHTKGTGVFRRVMGHSTPTLVDGHGHVEGDTLVLDQTISGEGTKARTRQWRMRRDGAGGYTGTLTDATHGIAGQVEGNRLHLAFTFKGGFATQQWLALAADGRSAHNVMVVRKLGVVVAVLDEDIAKVE